MMPLRAKLTIVYSAIFLASVAALELATYWSVSSALDSILQTELVARRAVVEEYVQNHLHRLTWPELSVSLAHHRGFQPEWIAIESGDGRLLFSGTVLAYARANPSASSARILREVRRIHGQEYVFLTGLDNNVAAAVLLRLRWLILLSAPLLLMGASAIGYWIAGRALKPVRQIATAAMSIDAHNLSTRLTVPATRDELQSLGETINLMLDRIEAGYRQMSQFTANASHELRSPVAIIRSTAEVALLHPGPDKTPERNALRRILRLSERNSELLEDMLQLARLDAGSGISRCEPVDLSSSLRDVAEAFLPQARKQGKSLRSATPHQRVTVMADASHLSRLWTILIDNALKYTASGGEIQITLATDGEVSITDTGCGVAPEDLPHIFDRFYRADKSRGAGPVGFGLGLALARQIAQAHHASIHVESTLGIGTVVRMFFPTLASLPQPDAISDDSQVNHIALK